MNKKTIHKYLITKYMGGGTNIPRAQNIKYELEDGYEKDEKKRYDEDSS